MKKKLVASCDLAFELTIKFVDVGAADKRIDPLKFSFSGSASKNITGEINDDIKAELFNNAKSDAISGMSGTITMKIRQHEYFLLKTKVLVAEGGDITIELGKDLGISCGDEFKIEIEEPIQGTEFTKKTEVGYVRIHTVEEGASVGKLLWGSDVQAGDPVKENALFGTYIDLRLGIASWVRTKEFRHLTGIETFTGGAAQVESDGKDDLIMPAVALSIGQEIGYAWKIEAQFSSVIPTEGDLLSFLFELGPRYTFYLGGRMSLDIGIFGTLGGMMGTYKSNYDGSFGVAADGNNDEIDYFGMVFGGKGEINFYYQLHPNFKLGIGGGFRFTTDVNKDNITIKVDGTEVQRDVIKSTVDTLYGDKADDFKSNFVGPFANITIQGRF